MFRTLLGGLVGFSVASVSSSTRHAEKKREQNDQSTLHITEIIQRMNQQNQCEYGTSMRYPSANERRLHFLRHLVMNGGKTDGNDVYESSKEGELVRILKECLKKGSTFEMNISDKGTHELIVKCDTNAIWDETFTVDQFTDISDFHLWKEAIVLDNDEDDTSTIEHEFDEHSVILYLMGFINKDKIHREISELQTKLRKKDTINTQTSKSEMKEALLFNQVAWATTMNLMPLQSDQCDTTFKWDRFDDLMSKLHHFGKDLVFRSVVLAKLKKQDYPWKEKWKYYIDRSLIILLDRLADHQSIDSDDIMIDQIIQDFQSDGINSDKLCVHYDRLVEIADQTFQPINLDETMQTDVKEEEKEEVMNDELNKNNDCKQMMNSVIEQAMKKHANPTADQRRLYFLTQLWLNPNEPIYERELSRRITKLIQRGWECSLVFSGEGQSVSLESPDGHRTLDIWALTDLATVEEKLAESSMLNTQKSDECFPDEMTITLHLLGLKEDHHLLYEIHCLNEKISKGHDQSIAEIAEGVISAQTIRLRILSVIVRFQKSIKMSNPEQWSIHYCRQMSSMSQSSDFIMRNQVYQTLTILSDDQVSFLEKEAEMWGLNTQSLNAFLSMIDDTLIKLILENPLYQRMVIDFFSDWKSIQSLLILHSLYDPIPDPYEFISDIQQISSQIHNNNDNKIDSFTRAIFQRCDRLKSKFNQRKKKKNNHRTIMPKYSNILIMNDPSEDIIRLWSVINPATHLFSDRLLFSHQSEIICDSSVNVKRGTLEKYLGITVTLIMNDALPLSDEIQKEEIDYITEELKDYTLVSEIIDEWNEKNLQMNGKLFRTEKSRRLDFLQNIFDKKVRMKEKDLARTIQSICALGVVQCELMMPNIVILKWMKNNKNHKNNQNQNQNVKWECTPETNLNELCKLRSKLAVDLTDSSMNGKSKRNNNNKKLDTLSLTLHLFGEIKNNINPEKVKEEIQSMLNQEQQQQISDDDYSNNISSLSEITESLLFDELVKQSTLLINRRSHGRSAMIVDIYDDVMKQLNYHGSDPVFRTRVYSSVMCPNIDSQISESWTCDDLFRLTLFFDQFTHMIRSDQMVFDSKVILDWYYYHRSDIKMHCILLYSCGLDMNSMFDTNQPSLMINPDDLEDRLREQSDEYQKGTLNKNEISRIIRSLLNDCKNDDDRKQSPLSLFDYGSILRMMDKVIRSHPSFHQSGSSIRIDGIEISMIPQDFSEYNTLKVGHRYSELLDLYKQCHCDVTLSDLHLACEMFNQFNHQQRVLDSLTLAESLNFHRWQFANKVPDFNSEWVINYEQKLVSQFTQRLIQEIDRCINQFIPGMTIPDFPEAIANMRPFFADNTAIYTDPQLLVRIAYLHVAHDEITLAVDALKPIERQFTGMNPWVNGEVFYSIYTQLAQYLSAHGIQLGGTRSSSSSQSRSHHRRQGWH